MEEGGVQPARARRFDDGLARARPCERGVDSAAVMRFLDDVEAAGLELHDLMIWRGDAVVAEGWRWPYGPDRLRLTHSMTKSFTACAIGLLIEDGKLALDDRVAGFFPELAISPDTHHGRMTVEDLLTMRTGHADEVSGAVWREIATSWVDEFFRIPIVHEPGTRYVYSSAASYMLSAVASRVTGTLLVDYLRPRLFDPLDIVEQRWDVGTDGINPGGNGLSLRTADCLKLGILHARSGNYSGRDVLPRSWVEAATRPQGDPEYGYHWVVAPTYFAALGVFVQMALVFPAHDAVVMFNGAMHQSGVFLPHVNRCFPRAFESGTGDDDVLAARLAGWSEPDPLRSTADIPPGLAGRWQVGEGHAGVAGIAIEFDSAQALTLTLVDAGGAHPVRARKDGWEESETSLPGADLHHGYRLDGTPTLAGYRVREDGTIEIVLHFVETAFRDTIVLDLDGDRLRLDRSVNINSGLEAWPTLVATRA